MNLATFLQYSTAVAERHLQEFLSHFVDEVYQPATEDYTILVSTGNTDGYVAHLYILRLISIMVDGTALSQCFVTLGKVFFAKNGHISQPS
jgi:hypothetical protein